MKKRLLALVLSAIMALPLVACGDSNVENGDKEVKQPSISKMAEYKDVAAILDKVAKNNEEVYFNNLVNAVGIGLVEVKDRDTVQAGDIVLTDYTGYVDDKPFKGGSTISDGKSNPQYIDVSNNCGYNTATGSSSGGFIDKFTDGLIGAKKNEDKSGKVTFPDGYGDTTLIDGDDDSKNDVKVSLNKKEATFVFNVKAIYEKTTLENITDAIVAEKMSKDYGVSTVAELMKLVKEDAEKAVFNSYFDNVIYSAGISTVEIKNRDTVQKGDLVKIDYAGYYEGSKFKASTASDQWVDVENNCVINTATGAVAEKLHPGFSDGLVGMKVNEEKNHDVTLPNNFGQTTLLDDDKDDTNNVKVDLSGKTVTYKLKVKNIYMVVTQESITDEIVKEHFEESYGVTTVADFMKVLKEEIAYSNIINNIIGNTTFDISESYLKLRVDEYQKLFEELYCGSEDISKVLSQYYGVTLENARAQWTVTLTSQIKAELVFAEIVKNETLKADEKEINDYLKGVINAASGENGNEFLQKESNIYKMIGSGNEEIGKAYLENQHAVRAYVVGLYNALSAK